MINKSKLREFRLDSSNRKITILIILVKICLKKNGMSHTYTRHN